MDFNQLLDIIITLGGGIGLAMLFFFYFTNSKVKNAVDIILNRLSFILNFAKRFVKDKKGEFDIYDALELMTRVSGRIKETVENIENTRFEDVEEEVFDIIRDELSQYKNLPGTPELDDPAIKMVFQSIQRALLDENHK